MRQLGLVIALALLPAATGSAQWVRTEHGTAVIRGRVTAAENARPLARADVSLTGRKTNRSLIADESGWFEFAGLPEGRYEIRAASAGFLTSKYGQSEPGGHPLTVALSPGQLRSDINVALPKGGVIVVSVTDDDGEPMEGVWVQAQALQSRRGRMSFKPEIDRKPRTTATDDRGRIRIYDLAPGDYYVSASENAVPPRVSDRGPAKNFRRLQTFYPGVVRAADAKPVTLGLGQEVELDIAIVQTPVAEISGRVMHEDGSALSPSTVSMTPLVPGRFEEERPLWNAARGEEFRFTSVLPGDYLITSYPDPTNPLLNDVGSLEVSVAGSDLTGLIVIAKPAATLRGRIALDTGALVREWSGYDFTPSITLEDARFRWSQAVPPEGDGAFVLRGRTGRGLGWGGEGHGWYLKAVTRGGKDVTDAPIDFSPGETVENIRVVVTREHTEVTGTARDAARTPATEFAVVIFPEDRSRWVEDSRYVAAVEGDEHGRFTVRGLPPGRYLAAAIDASEARAFDPAIREPESLERLRLRAMPIRLRIGQPVSVTLDLVER